MKKLFLLFAVLFTVTINAQYNLNFYDYLGYSNRSIVKEFGIPEDIENLNSGNMYYYLYNKNINSDLIETSSIIFCFDRKNNRVKLVTLGYKLRKDKGEVLDKFAKEMGEKFAKKKFKLIDKKFNTEKDSYSLILYNSNKDIKIEIEIKDINIEYLSIILFAYKIN